VDISAGSGQAHFAVSRNGTLIYVAGRPGEAIEGNRVLAWRDADGRTEQFDPTPRNYSHPAISPDGSQVAVSIEDANEDVWIWHAERETLTRLTFAEGPDDVPLWTPDGRRVVFRSSRDGGGLYWQAADGTGDVEPILTGGSFAPWGWTADGRLVFTRGMEGNPDIGVVTLGGAPAPEFLMDSEFAEFRPAVSPDGRWLAYQSNESGQDEVYVRPLPDVDSGRWQVSTQGGREPKWSPDGSRLYFVDGTALTGNMMAADVEDTPLAFVPGTPRVLFDYAGRYWLPPGQVQTYDVGPDGRFVLVALAESGTSAPDGQGQIPELILVQDWFTELRRLTTTP